MVKYKNIVLNVPHSSIEGLCDSGWELESGFFAQVKNWTDWHTDYLFKSILPSVTMVRAALSRFVVDTERLINDPLEEIGQGIVYKLFEGYKRKLAPNEELLLMRFYDAHQQRLRSQLTPESLLVDCHSFPSSLSADIDVCIGYNDDWSKPDDETIHLFMNTFERAGLRVGINEPYSNSISPETSFAYPSIMVELNKRIYMDEQTLDLLPQHLVVRNCLSSIYESFL